MVARIEAEDETKKSGKTHCLKLLRDETTADYHKFAANMFGLRRQTADHAGSDEDLDIDEAGNAGQDQATSTDSPNGQDVPHWSPDLHYANTIFELVEASGTQGISSFDLAGSTFGQFYRRPFDEGVAKLSDMWHASQPPHLRHLALVRDTYMGSPILQYCYRTFAYFNEAVRLGQASWEYVLSENHNHAASSLERRPNLDKFGFPRPESRLFYAKTGLAPVTRCGRIGIGRSLTKGKILGRSLIARLDSEDDGRVKKAPMDKKARTSLAWAPSENLDTPQESPMHVGLAHISSQPSVSIAVDTEVHAQRQSSDQQPAVLDDGEVVDRPASQPDATSSTAESAPIQQGRLPKRKQSEVDGHEPSNMPTVPAKRGRPPNENTLRKRARIAEMGDVADADGDVFSSPPTSPVTWAVQRLVTKNASANSDFATKRIERERLEWHARCLRVAESRLRREAMATTASRYLPAPVEPVDDNPQESNPTIPSTRDASAVAEQAASNKGKRRTRPAQPTVYIDPEHINRLAQQLAMRSAPGVYVNPPGSILLKMREAPSIGRPRNALIAVFKLNRLSDFQWFIKDILNPWPVDTLSAMKVKSAGPPRKKLKAGISPPSSEEPLFVPDTERMEVDVLQTPAVNHTGTATSSASHLPPALHLDQPPLDQGLQVATSVKTNDHCHVHVSGVPEQSITTSDNALASGCQPGMSTADSIMTQLRPDAVASSNISTKFAAAPMVQTQSPTVKDVVMSSSPRSQQVSSIRADATKSIVLDNSSAIPSESRSIQGALLEIEPTNEMREVMGTPHRTPNTMTIHGSEKSRRNDGKIGLRTTGGMAKHRRQQVVLDIVKRCGGLFPGDGEMHISFISEMERIHNSKPDRVTMMRDIRHLVESGKLQQIGFTVNGKNDEVVQRHIIMFARIDPAGEAVRNLKTEITNMYPRVFLPQGTPLADRYKKRQRAEHNSRRATSTTRPAQEAIMVKRLAYLNGQAVEYPESFRERLDREKLARQQRHKAEEEAQQRYENAADDDEAAAAALALQSELPRSRARPRMAARLRFGDLAPTARGRGLGPLKKYKDRDTERRDAPRSLENILDRAPGTTRQKLTAFDANNETTMFDREIDLVSAWEKRQIRDGLQDEPSPALSFINHTTPAIQALDAVPLHWVDDPLSPVNAATQLSSTSRSRRPLMAHNARAASDDMMLDKRKPGRPRTRPLPDPMRPKRGRGRPKKGDSSLEPAESLVPMGPRRLFERRIVEDSSNVSMIESSHGIHSTADLSVEDQERLMLALAVVLTLTGGIDVQSARSINWMCVAQSLHFKHDRKKLKSFWSTHKVKAGIPKRSSDLRDAFRESYLLALQCREIPDIDLDHPLDVDWAELVDWAENRIVLDENCAVDQTVVDLPASRKELEKRSLVKESVRERTADTEGYFNAFTGISRRDEYAETYIYNVPLRPRAPREESTMLAKSWIRALACTAEETYDAQTAKQKLELCGEKALLRAQDELMSQRTLRQANRGQILPGRSLALHEEFKRSFKRIWDERTFQEAADYKREADEQIQRSGMVELRPFAPDAHHMVALNLYGYGMTVLTPGLPPVDNTLTSNQPHLSKWGFTDGNYKTVHMDRSRLQFSLVMSATPTYRMGSTLNTDSVPLALDHQVKDEPYARLPYWVTINGEMVSSMWKLMLISVLYMLSMRPGTTIEGMEAAHKGRLWGWELRLAVEWAEKKGVAKRCGPAGDGWTTTEGWYMALA